MFKRDQKIVNEKYCVEGTSPVVKAIVMNLWDSRVGTGHHKGRIYSLHCVMREVPVEDGGHWYLHQG